MALSTQTQAACLLLLLIASLSSGAILQQQVSIRGSAESQVPGRQGLLSTPTRVVLSGGAEALARATQGPLHSYSAILLWKGNGRNSESQTSLFLKQPFNDRFKDLLQIAQKTMGKAQRWGGEAVSQAMYFKSK